MTDRIKKCPFCGGKAGVYYDYNKWARVQCKECGINTLFSFAEKEAIKQWNTRKPMDRIVEQLEEAKGKPYTDGVHTYNENDFIDIDKAIEIVKEGGKDE